MISELITNTFNIALSELPNAKYVHQFLYNKEDLIYEYHQLRDAYVKHSFPILCHETIIGMKKIFNEFGITKIIELSCGTGWLTYWLRKYGVDVLKCVDNFTWKKFKDNILPIVEKQDSVECVKQNPDVDLFILSWPYMDSVAHDVFRAMKKGQYLLYIGEGYGGCTADDNFFNLVYKYKCVADNIFLLQFYGIHDDIFLFKKELNEGGK